jgi:hypothetical protein
MEYRASMIAASSVAGIMQP